MSLEMTFRQKLIRIGCSAAVCGLSISFLIGEAVDEKAKGLRSFVVDPRILPENYLPLRPVLSALDRLDSPAWQENVVAINSLPALPMAMAELPRVLAATPEDRVLISSAAPVLAAPP